MQLIGARLIVLCPSASYGLQWKSGYLRASSEPVRELVHLLRPDIQVRGARGVGTSVCGIMMMLACGVEWHSLEWLL